VLLSACSICQSSSCQQHASHRHSSNVRCVSPSRKHSSEHIGERRRPGRSISRTSSNAGSMRLVVAAGVVTAGVVTGVVILTWGRRLRKRSCDAAGSKHARLLAAAVDAMVLGSSKHITVPPLHDSLHGEPPTRGWQRCMAAMAGVQSCLDDAPDVCDASANDQILASSCTTAKLSASSSKACVDALLAMHALQTFPDLTAEMAADSGFVLLLLDAPNMLTTTALAGVFPALRQPAFAARVCIPQADPGHYALMMETEASMLLCNVRFQRLDTWLAANAKLGLRVPIFFADYETSVYGKRSMGLHPLQDLQRFLRYGYAGPKCLLGVTLSFRSLHKRHYPAEAPVLTPDDLTGFLAHEASCAGMTCALSESIIGHGIARRLSEACASKPDRSCAPTGQTCDWLLATLSVCVSGELLEHYQYGLTFALFLLEKKPSAGGTDSSVVDPAGGGGMREVARTQSNTDLPLPCGASSDHPILLVLRRTVK
jgi:hypothetical protein